MSQITGRRRPQRDEYHDFYHGYVSLVPETDIVGCLKGQLTPAIAQLEAIPEARHGYRYAPGKWTTREVVGHIVDTEWIFTYRALRFARGDATPLPGMDQDEFMAGANFEDRSMTSLTTELRHLRSANLALFASLDDAILERRGVASDCEFTVKALMYIIAGHMRHHLGVLEQRYR